MNHNNFNTIVGYPVKKKKKKHAKTIKLQKPVGQKVVNFT
jgi:hypothetical protein